MRLPYLIFVLFCLTLSLSLCSQINRDKFKTPLSPTTYTDTSLIAIIPFTQSGNWPFKPIYKPASLNQKELKEIDSLLNNCIEEYNAGLSEQLKPRYGVDRKKYKYKRQYVAALNPSGEKEVWINCFCSSMGERWKKELMLVDDGGNCYFNLKVNLNTKMCYEMVVNGYA